MAVCTYLQCAHSLCSKNQEWCRIRLSGRPRTHQIKCHRLPLLSDRSIRTSICSFDTNDLLHATGLKDRHQNRLVALLDHFNDLLGELLVIVCRLAHFDLIGKEKVVFCLPIFQQEADLPTFFCGQHLQLRALDEWYLNVVTTWAKIFILLGSEDVNSDNVCLRVAMLPGLGCCHLSNLARVTFDHDVASLSQLACLHWVAVG